MLAILKKQYQPAPGILRAIGNAIMYGCSIGAVNQIIQADKWLSVGFIVAGAVGHCLANLPVKKKK